MIARFVVSNVTPADVISFLADLGLPGGTVWPCIGWWVPDDDRPWTDRSLGGDGPAEPETEPGTVATVADARLTFGRVRIIASAMARWAGETAVYVEAGGRAYLVYGDVDRDVERIDVDPQSTED